MFKYLKYTYFLNIVLLHDTIKHPYITFLYNIYLKYLNFRYSNNFLEN